MNYIELINQFWRTRRSKRITSTQADLYFCLLQESNEREWENPFEFPNTSICARIGITEPTLIDARARLKQLGLIDFEGGERKVKSPIYTILNLNNLSKRFSKNRAKTEDNLEQKPSKKVNIISKQNKTETKQDNTPMPPKGDNQQINSESHSLKTEREREKSGAKKEKELQFPFESPKFHEVWAVLVAMPKWHKKTENALQMALKQLSRYDEEFAIKLMENAISGGYQGVVFNNTDLEYEKWKNNKGGKNNGRHAGSDFD